MRPLAPIWRSWRRRMRQYTPKMSPCRRSTTRPLTPIWRAWRWRTRKQINQTLNDDSPCRRSTTRPSTRTWRGWRPRMRRQSRTLALMWRRRRPRRQKVRAQSSSSNLSHANPSCCYRQKPLLQAQPASCVPYALLAAAAAALCSLHWKQAQSIIAFSSSGHC